MVSHVEIDLFEEFRVCGLSPAISMGQLTVRPAPVIAHGFYQGYAFFVLEVQLGVLEELKAAALEDPELRLVFWLLHSAGWVEYNGVVRVFFGVEFAFQEAAALLNSILHPLARKNRILARIVFEEPVPVATSFAGKRVRGGPEETILISESELLSVSRIFGELSDVDFWTETQGGQL